MSGRLGAALEVERLKLLTTRMWWILLLIMVVYVAFIAGVFALVYNVTAGDPTAGAPASDVSTIYTIGLAIGYPFIIGVLAMTAEYRYQTLTPTFLAEPSRGVVLTAKLVVNLLFGFVAGLLAMATGVLVAAPILVLGDSATALGEADTWSAIARACLAMALWTGIGVGLGTLVRNQIAGVVIIIAFSQLIEPVARAVLSIWETTSDIAQYLPGAAAEAMAGASLFNFGGDAPMLEWWQAALVMAGYVALFVLLGGRTTLRRDVT
jgi:ABC-2 type transport system permease protein